MSIDIAKKYTTRGGLPARIYAADGAGEYPVHGAIRQDGRWFFMLWASPTGRSNKLDSQYDLIPVKTWRAWKDGEAPVRVMLRQKGLTLVETRRTMDCDLTTLFLHYVRVHEDGTETPCGVEE